MRSPSLTHNGAQQVNLEKLSRLLASRSGTKRVLIVGAGTAGPLIPNASIEFVLTDVWTYQESTSSATCRSFHLRTRASTPSLLSLYSSTFPIQQKLLPRSTVC